MHFRRIGIIEFDIDRIFNRQEWHLVNLPFCQSAKWCFQLRWTEIPLCQSAICTIWVLGNITDQCQYILPVFHLQNICLAMLMIISFVIPDCSLLSHLTKVDQTNYEICALLPGQFTDHYQTYSAQELSHLPLNTALKAPPVLKAGMRGFIDLNLKSEKDCTDDNCSLCSCDSFETDARLVPTFSVNGTLHQS